MSRKFILIFLMSIVFLLGISAISAEDNNTLTISEYNTIDNSEDTLSDLNIDEIDDSLSESENSQDMELNSDKETTTNYNTTISTQNTNIPKSTYFSITLTDSEGNAISNQSVTFNLCNTNYTQKTDDNGVASLKIDLTPGSYNMTVYYLGDSTYNPTKSNFTIVSYQIASKIVAQSTKILRGNYFTIYLYDTNNNPLSAQSVTFNLNGNTYTRTTNSKGAASLKISQKVGNYGVTITYAGEGAYTGVTKTFTITSYRLATKITPVSKKIVKGNYFTVTLKDKNSNVLKGEKVIIKISNKKYTRTTNSNGKASVKIKLTAKKYYKVKVTYKGSASYKASSKTVKIYVKAKKVYGQLLVKGKTVTKNGKTYIVSTSNKNTVLVKSGGKLTLKNSKITKKGSVSNSNAENSDFYGTNAAVLITSKSTLKISGSTITTNAKGANAIFVTNLDSSSSGATAYVNNVVINTYKDKSRGLDATYGGKIVADKVTIYTRGGSCAALATDRGEGTIIASNCKLYTGVGQKSGSGSPLIYSTGDITVSKSTGTSYVSQIACIEGKNSITLKDCDFTGYGKGNRYVNGKYVDLAGVFLYQSMSGDADVGVSKFTASNTKLTISSSSSYYKSAPMFYVTNTDANINLESCTLNYGSGILLNAAGQNQWGKSGSNGGDVTFTATSMTLSGKIIIDKISSLKLTLSNSNYNGCINPSSSYGSTKLTINSGSTWTLTGDSHITSLSNSGTINYGSYTLYVNGKAYTAANPYTG